MKKWFLRGIVLLVLLTALLSIYLSVDWCSFYAAVPPETVEVLDNSQAAITQFEIDRANVLVLPPSFNCGQIVMIQGALQLDLPKWRWMSIQESFMMSPSTLAAKNKQEQDLPQPVVEIAFVRKSSIGSGEIVASHTTHTVRHKKGMAPEFSGKLECPQSEGMYRMRVILWEIRRSPEAAISVTRRTIWLGNVEVKKTSV